MKILRYKETGSGFGPKGTAQLDIYYTADIDPKVVWLLKGFYNYKCPEEDKAEKITHFAPIYEVGNGEIHAIYKPRFETDTRYKLEIATADQLIAVINKTAENIAGMSDWLKSMNDAVGRIKDFDKRMFRSIGHSQVYVDSELVDKIRIVYSANKEMFPELYKIHETYMDLDKYYTEEEFLAIDFDHLHEVKVELFNRYKNRACEQWLYYNRRKLGGMYVNITWDSWSDGRCKYNFKAMGLVDGEVKELEEVHEFKSFAECYDFVQECINNNYMDSLAEKWKCADAQLVLTAITNQKFQDEQETERIIAAKNRNAKKIQDDAWYMLKNNMRVKVENISPEQMRIVEKYSKLMGEDFRSFVPNEDYTLLEPMLKKQYGKKLKTTEVNGGYIVSTI